MPLATMAPACSRIVRASTFSAKWFQLFQPMGGVAARLFSCAHTDVAAAHQIAASTTASTARKVFSRRIKFLSFINRATLYTPLLPPPNPFPLWPDVAAGFPPFCGGPDDVCREARHLRPWWHSHSWLCRLVWEC